MITKKYGKNGRQEKGSTPGIEPSTSDSLGVRATFWPPGFLHTHIRLICTHIRLICTHIRLICICMWRIGFVDTVNLRSHMPTMKRRQPTSGLRGLPSMPALMVFIMVDVREYKPRTQPGSKWSSTITTLALTYQVSTESLLARREGGFVEAPPCRI